MGKDGGIQLDNKRHDWELQVAVPLVWCVMLEPSRRTLFAACRTSLFPWKLQHGQEKTQSKWPEYAVKALRKQ